VGEYHGDFLLHVTCSKGTYIRTLCSDIGEALGCGACLSELRRTRAGKFSVADAHTLDEIEQIGTEAFLRPVDTLFDLFPPLIADSFAERQIRVGADFSLNVPEGKYRIYSENGEFLMLGRAASGSMSTIKSFFEV
jgi:tRNA pseudouridine55 synthase